MSAPTESVIASEARQSMPEDETELNLFDVLTALGEEKLTLFLVPLVICIIAIVQSLVATPSYTARTSILPGQSSAAGGGSAALASLSGLAGMAGLAGLSGLSSLSGAMKSSDEMYIALMRSQTMQDSLIEKFALKQRYGSRSIEDARLALSSHVAIASDKKSGFINIDAQDTDPQFAAKLANQQVEELRLTLGRLAVTDAQKARLFYEQRVKKTQTSLAEVELRFRQALEKAGMQATSLWLAESSVMAGAGLRSQIVSLEIQLQALSRFVTPQSQEVQRINSELAALRTQLARYEQGTGRSSATPAQQEAAQAYRDLKVHETMLDSFVRQLEAAKIDEAKEGPQIQVVDVALAPEIRSSPQRAKYVTNAALAGVLLGVVLALVKSYLGRMKNSEQGSSHLAALRRAWWFRKSRTG
jgi:uncharacterized protein involved in exopolysaccharide biosynthesis